MMSEHRMPSPSFSVDPTQGIFSSLRTRVTRTQLLGCALLAFSLPGGPLLAATPDASAPGMAVWPVQEMRTSIELDADLLDGMGIEIELSRATAKALDHHPLSIVEGGDTAFTALVGPSLGLEVADGQPVGFTGLVRHEGGFVLRWTADGFDDGEADLRGFGLRGIPPTDGQGRPAPGRLGLELVDARGDVLLVGDHMHHDLHSGEDRLRAFNMDLRMTSTLAERLGEPRLEGFRIGTLSLEARVVRTDLDPPGRSATKGGDVCDDFSGDVDVELNEMSNVNNVRQSDGRVAMTPSAELVNVGTANAPWYSKFSGPFPPYDNDQHPLLTWAFYRVSDGRMEQLAVSDVKHAFLTLNFGCEPGACTDEHILGLGCGDIYGSGTNNQDTHLSYRHEITPNRALWENTGSHFDQDGNGSQDHPPNNPDGPFDHRSWVNESELETPDATYFMEAWYLVRDDIDIFNSMGRRQVTPGKFGNTWFFDNAGPYTKGSVLDSWVDPENPEPDSLNHAVATEDGHAQLAVKTTYLGAGLYRYEYLLRNHDFSPQISSLRLPIDGANILETDFRDIDDLADNDWQATVNEKLVLWQLPAGAPASPRHTGGVALDWGLAYNFTIVAEGAPVPTQARAGRFQSGAGGLQFDTLAPGPPTAIFADGFESGSTSAWAAP